MADSNPFKKWLGLAAADPDYFQLLGLNRSEKDKAIITRAAKGALARLGESAPPADETSWKLVRRQIKLAYKCLIDPVARETYLSQIEAADSRPQTTKSDRMAAPNRPAAKPPESEFGVKQTGADSDQDTEWSIDTVVDDLRSLASADVPMAEVVDEPPIAKPAVAATVPPPPPAGSPIAVNTGKKVKRRFKIVGRLVPVIFATLVIIGLIAGGVYWIFNQQDIISDQLTNNADEDRQQPAEQNSQIENSQMEKKNPVVPPPAAQQQQDDNARDAINDAIDVAIAGEQPKPTGASRQSSTSNSSKSNSSAEGAAQWITVQVQWENTGTPNAVQRVQLAQYFNETWHGIRRRDFQWTDHNLELARQLPMNRDQQRAWELLRLIELNYQHFWQQVESIGSQLRAADEFEIDEAYISIVEAKPEQLVYRLAGRSVASQYDRLPTLIALAIACKDLAPEHIDTQRYRSLLYAIAARQNPFLIDKANDTIDLAAKFGVDALPLREFLQLDWTELLADVDLAAPSDAAAIQQARQQLASPLPDSSRIQRMSHNEAIQATQELLERAIQQSEPPARELLLDTAAKTALATGDAYRIIQVLDLRAMFIDEPQWVPRYLTAFRSLRRARMDDNLTLRYFVGLLELYHRCLDEGDEDAANRILALAVQHAESKDLKNWLEKFQRLGGDPEELTLSM